MQRQKIGILGATGMVGQRFIQLLERHPWFEVAWLAASDKSSGKRYGDAVKWKLDTAIPTNIADMLVSPATPAGAPKIIFAALDSDIARELEPQFAAAGCAVISNSSAFRMQEDVPLVIPEVNASHLPLLESQIYCYESELLGDWISTCAETSRRALRDRVDFCQYHAGGKRRGLSRRGIARYSRERRSLHQERRRKDAGRDAEAAGHAEGQSH